MSTLQVAPLTPSLKDSLPQLAKDFRAAFSYVSFYSMDSPFVTQAVKKLFHELEPFLVKRAPLLFERGVGTVLLNGSPLPESESFAKVLESHSCPGVLLERQADYAALVTFLRKSTSPSERSADLKTEMASNDMMKHILWAEPGSYDLAVPAADQEPEPEKTATDALSPDLDRLVSFDAPVPVLPATPEPLPPDQPDTLSLDMMEAEIAATERSETLLSLLAEAWQYSQLLKRHKASHPEADPLDKTFDRLFNRMLAKLETFTPEFGAIHDWFSTPEGEALPDRVADSMLPLMETAVRNGWTSVLRDPATEGLVADCLTQWGSTGKHELVERAVTAISESLNRAEERWLALSHLRDPRPWVRNDDLLKTVLRRLVQMIAGEWDPAAYQTSLLLAWDLLEPGIESMKNEPEPVLALLSTLQLHAEDEAPPFKDRPLIARYWLYEKTNSEMMRRLVLVARDAGKLRQFSVLGMAAAPLMVEDYFGKSGEDQLQYLDIFREIREAVQAVIIEKLPEMENEQEVKSILPVIHACGMDPLVAMQLSPWVARGSLDLKRSIIQAVSDMEKPEGGPSLRLAVLDDDESVAEAAIRAFGRIRYTAAGLLLVKAAQIRRKHHPGHEKALIATCDVLGEWAQPESVQVLMELARKKPLLALPGQTPSPAVRLAAVRALGNFDSPEVWRFMEEVAKEKNPELQEVLHAMIEKRAGGI